MDYDPFDYVSLSGDNMDILGDMRYKFLVHDCMWSGTCKEDNLHETTNKFSEFSYFSTSPSYGSIFDIFNIDDENSLGELNGDNDYDTSDQDDLPLNGLSPDTNDDIHVLGTSSLTPDLPPSSSVTCSTLTPTTSSATSKLTSNAKLASATATASTSTNGKATSTATKASVVAAAVAPTINPKAPSTSKANKLTNYKSTISATVAAKQLLLTTPVTDSNVIPTTSTIVTATSVISSTATTPIIASSSNTIASSPSSAASTAATSLLKSTGKPRNAKSLYPERRTEHNNSEKKRRDHLRNAFNHLRDQIPKLKDGEKKAARVTILKEAVSYVTLLKEKHRYLERTKNAETIKNENLLKRLKMLQSNIVM